MAWALPTEASVQSTRVPAAIIRALDHSSPAEQKRIYAKLTPEQQLAVSTPGAVKFLAPTDEAEQGLTLGTPQIHPQAPLGLANTQKCGPYLFTATPAFEVDALAGNTLYVWHFDIQWTGNCKTISDLNYHYAYPSNIFFLEHYQGKVADTMQGKGSPYGTATGAGRMAACFHIGPVNQCFAESHPMIHIDFAADGSGSWYGTA